MILSVTPQGLTILKDFSENAAICHVYALHYAYHAFYNTVYTYKLIAFKERDFAKAFIKKIAKVYNFKIMEFNTTTEQQDWLKDPANLNENLVEFPQTIQNKIFYIISNALSAEVAGKRIIIEENLHRITQPLFFDKTNQKIIDYITTAGATSLFSELTKNLIFRQEIPPSDKTQANKKKKIMHTAPKRKMTPTKSNLFLPLKHELNDNTGGLFPLNPPI